jgi:hypothetical protein
VPIARADRLATPVCTTGIANRDDKTFVVTETVGMGVVAYYAWCMSQISPAEAPARLQKGAGRYPQPVALLARLGVDIRHERRGLGAVLLQDVFTRLLELSDDIGCRGLLIHAESPDARDFYLHLVPELEPSPTDDLHLVLLIEGHPTVAQGVKADQSRDTRHPYRSPSFSRCCSASFTTRR